MKSLPRILTLTSLLLIGLWQPAQAQYTFGVRWEAPENNRNAQEQLHELRQMGISHLEVSSPMASEVWETIEELNFIVYGSLGIRFPVTETFSEPDSTFIRSIEQQAKAYIDQPSVTAIELFENGAIMQEEFSSALTPYASQIKHAVGKDLYFSTDIVNTDFTEQVDFYFYNVSVSPSNSTTFDLPADNHIRGYRYLPSSDLESYLGPLKQFLEMIPAQTVIFFEAEWLFSVSETHPYFRTTLYELATKSDAVFPVPHETLPQSDNSSSFPSLLLLLVWGSIAIHYSSSPLYRKSAFRYFRGHKFFIRDIFHRQMRSSIPALTIIIQNAFILAICTFSTAAALWSDTGLEALFHYLPALEIFPHGPFSLAVWTFGAVLLLSFISMFWLYLSHVSIYSLTQVATIYAWPMQVNFLLGIIAVALFSADSHHIFIVSVTLAAIIIFLLSFIFASVDIYKHLRKKAGLYLFGTGGVYLILVVLAVILAVYSTWWDGLQLSLQFK